MEHDLEGYTNDIKQGHTSLIYSMVDWPITIRKNLRERISRIDYELVLISHGEWCINSFVSCMLHGVQILSRKSNCFLIANLLYRQPWLNVIPKIIALVSSTIYSIETFLVNI